MIETSVSKETGRILPFPFFSRLNCFINQIGKLFSLIIVANGIFQQQNNRVKSSRSEIVAFLQDLSKQSDRGGELKVWVESRLIQNRVGLSVCFERFTARGFGLNVYVQNLNRKP